MTEKLNLAVPLEKITISGFSIDDFKTFNSEAYTILCRLGEICDGLNYFPNTSKIVLDYNNQSHIISHNLQMQFIPNLAKDLEISQQAAIQKSIDFFSDKKIVVQPNGLQGRVYNAMRATQNYLPMAYTSEAVSVLKTTGMTGIQIITKAPLTFVGATYIGALFFSYFGSIAGNNTLGYTFNVTSYVLSRPMRGVEITLNGLILKPVSNLVGLPLIINGTQEMLNGKGISIEEYAKIGIAFERLTNSTTIKKIQKIYKVVRDKDS